MPRLQDGGYFAFPSAFFSNTATTTPGLGNASGSSLGSLTRAPLSQMPARSVFFLRARHTNA
jgi:hypothetical protein